MAGARAGQASGAAAAASAATARRGALHGAAPRAISPSGAPHRGVRDALAPRRRAPQAADEEQTLDDAQLGAMHCQEYMESTEDEAEDDGNGAAYTAKISDARLLNAGKALKDDNDGIPVNVDDVHVKEGMGDMQPPLATTNASLCGLRRGELGNEPTPVVAFHLFQRLAVLRELAPKLSKSVWNGRPMRSGDSAAAAAQAAQQALARGDEEGVRVRPGAVGGKGQRGRDSHGAPGAGAGRGRGHARVHI
mmetsp:Transcript_53818/g.131890  ORF Transcript_53818/g.131890 Transcript_53818/m.131890 type:complete len:250 (+) Transcript_53818:184-933(+)